MPGAVKLMKIILKNFIYVPFIGDSADFVFCCHRTGENFFTIELRMKGTDPLIFPDRCFQFAGKFCFPGNRLCFLQKIPFYQSFFRNSCMKLQQCSCTGASLTVIRNST